MKFLGAWLLMVAAAFVISASGSGSSRDKVEGFFGLSFLAGLIWLGLYCLFN